jgi:hypothetical protein
VRDTRNRAKLISAPVAARQAAIHHGGIAGSRCDRSRERSTAPRQLPSALRVATSATSAIVSAAELMVAVIFSSESPLHATS